MPRTTGHSPTTFLWLPPHGSSVEFGHGTDPSYILRVEAVGYRSQTINVSKVFKASGRKDENGGRNILFYKGDFPLGEILLEKEGKSPNQAPVPTATGGRGTS